MAVLALDVHWLAAYSADPFLVPLLDILLPMFQLIRRHRLWMLAGLMYLGIVLVLKKARLAYLPTDVAMHPARSIRRLWFSLPQLCQLFTIGL